MKLISFNGLNCYHRCIITIAHFWDVPYRKALATLWSETDFSCDLFNQVCVSRRLLTNLAALGMVVKERDFSTPKETEASLRSVPAGTWLILGSDAFYLPWSLFYQKICCNHYFIAYKENAEMLSCFDPTENKENISVALSEIAAHAFQVVQPIRVGTSSFDVDDIAELKKVRDEHPLTEKRILHQMTFWMQEKQDASLMPIKWVDAMVNNRHLYGYYCQNVLFPDKEEQPFFDKSFFLRWAAIKNGLLKGMLRVNNQQVIPEVCNQFQSLMKHEIWMADRMIEQLESL